ncbi:MAG: hypothetical protein DSZ05_05035 [Sulfurospirillum sp.]|nr:MAG: hypothetical protein DSZ05_05035 [Sulfurospirillum sp.]
MAAAIFESTIKSNPVGRWYIELKDTSDEERVEYCLDMDEYAQKIEEMGAEYGGDIEVHWRADENVNQQQLNEVRIEIARWEQKMQEDAAGEPGV